MILYTTLIIYGSNFSSRKVLENFIYVHTHREFLQPEHF